MAALVPGKNNPRLTGPLDCQRWLAAEMCDTGARQIGTADIGAADGLEPGHGVAVVAFRQGVPGAGSSRRVAASARTV